MAELSEEVCAALNVVGVAAVPSEGSGSSSEANCQTLGF